MLRETPRLLIVDDERLSRQTLIQAFRAENYQIWEAENGEQALALVRAHRPHIVLLDVNMPGMNGFEVCRRIKEDPEFTSTVVVILSSSQLETDHFVEGYRSGADDYLAFPIPPAQLRARLQALLRLKFAEEEAHYQAERYKALQIQNEALTRLAPLIIVGLDEECRIRIFNPFAEEISGYRADEVLGKNWIETFIPSRLKEELWRVWHSVVQNQAIGREHENPILTRQGKERWIRWKNTLLRSNGDFLMVLSLGEDITEQRAAKMAARENQRRLETLMSNLPGMAYRCQNDPEWTMEFVSEGCLTLTGYPPQALVGNAQVSYGSLIHPEDRPKVWEEVQAALEKKQPFQLLYRITTARGEDKWVWEQGQGVFDKRGNLLAIEGFITDVSRQKLAEESVRLRLAELEAVRHISNALRAAVTSQDLLPLMLDETLKALGTSAGAVWLYSPQEEAFRLEAARGWLAELPEAKFLAKGEVATKALSTREVCLVDELSKEKCLGDELRSKVPDGWRGVFIPIGTEKEILGTMCVALPQQYHLFPEQVNLLTSIGEIAAIALQRMRLHEQTVRRLQALQAFHGVGQIILSTPDMRLVLEGLLDHVIHLLEVDAAGVFLFNPITLRLDHIVGKGFLTPLAAQRRPRLGEGVSGRAALGRNLIIANDPRNLEDEAEKSLWQNEGFRTQVSLPLMAKGQLKGVLEVFTRCPLQTTQEWLSLLDTFADQAAIALENVHMFEQLQRANIQMTFSFDSLLEAWAYSLEERGHEPKGHLQRVAELTEQLCRAAGLEGEAIIHARRGALLHDIGKFATPETILFKAGPLSPEEWDIVRRHPQIAYDWLSTVEPLRPAVDIPYCHHERWDGSGYPRGLRGAEIPLAARLFAVADVWDILRCERPYRPAWPPEKALDYIYSHAGQHFDPQAVDQFRRLIERRRTF